MKALAFVLILGLTMMVAPAVTGQSEDPSDAVFQVVVLSNHENSYHGYPQVGYGTGFLISSDGTAITNSHVLYRVVHSPADYRAIAIVGKEFYDVSIVCASKLPYDPTKIDSAGRVVGGGSINSKDVAEIKLGPSTTPYKRFSYRTKDGQIIPLATAHTGSLSEFPFLTIGGMPTGTVRVIGFGGISAIPYKWSTTGQVGRNYTERYDGTPVFDIEFQNPAVPGNSGSPVLNDQNQVVGLWTWHYRDIPTKGTAQQSSVLKDPCN